MTRSWRGPVLSPLLRAAVLVAALAAALALLTAPGAQAAPAKPSAKPSVKKGFYACVTYNPSSGQLELKYNLKFLGKGKYQHSPQAKGTKLVDPTAGTYRVKGRRVTFRTGVMKSRYGKIDKASTPTVSIFSKKSGDTSIDCYRQS